YRIGELTRFTGLSRQSIHRYATLGLLSEEERTESGHRLFGEEVFDVLRRIETLKKTKTLEEIASLLRDSPRR
ncbi:MAG: MerR family DNA-binding transcriptional regulator, partial [Planctomycetota bacterium]|nr:MerR family DNA-binding transcriptional regulator [Planctomycetota bacterium]